MGLRLHAPFWCGFRDPLSSNVHRTFPVPPPSTLYGLIAAALGLWQDDYSRRDQMRFAVAIESAGEQVESYSKWMKIAEPAKDQAQKDARAAMRSRGLLTPDESVWISTTLVRQKLIQPTWVVGVRGAREVLEEIQSAIARPHWPLYLGESDDVVDIEFLGIEVAQNSTSPATGTVAGVHAGGTLANLPTRFVPQPRNKWELTRWLVTIPMPNNPIETQSDNLVASHGHVWQFEPEANPA
jgi:CRISPR-associated Cas5-like protein